MEIWKDVIDYEGIYKVSDLGRIKSLNYNSSGKEKIRELKTKESSYVVIILCSGSKETYKRKSDRVHRLVAKAFIPNPKNKPAVNHINGIKNDNRLENLEWVTNSENELHAHRIGLKSSPMKGKEGKNKREVKMYSLSGDCIKVFDSAKQAGKHLGISASCITHACKGDSKTCLNHLWKYY